MSGELGRKLFLIGAGIFLLVFFIFVWREEARDYSRKELRNRILFLISLIILTFLIIKSHANE